MKRLGIISGTLLSDGEKIVSDLIEDSVETDFGRATVFHNNDIVFIARHGTDADRHILPHLINHPANLTAMKQMGVNEIIGLYSTGSLKTRLKPGTFVVPDDYVLLGAGPTVVRGKATHIIPSLNTDVRRKIREAARDCGIDCVDGGIYWQTTGPRLETRAEIAMISQFADLVGMTMAGEAVIAQELEIPFASLCSVDNFAHGIEETSLSMEDVQRCAKMNSKAVRQIVIRFIERNVL